MKRSTAALVTRAARRDLPPRGSRSRHRRTGRRGRCRKWRKRFLAFYFRRQEKQERRRIARSETPAAIPGEAGQGSTSTPSAP